MAGNITILNAHVIGRLAGTVAALLLLWLPAAADIQPIDSLYTLFNNSSGNRHVRLANELMAVLYNNGGADSAYHFGNQEASRVEAVVHCFMAEHLLHNGQIDAAQKACLRCHDATTRYNTPALEHRISLVTSLVHCEVADSCLTHGDSVGAHSALRQAIGMQNQLYALDTHTSPAATSSALHWLSWLCAALGVALIAAIAAIVMLHRRQQRRTEPIHEPTPTNDDNATRNMPKAIATPNTHPDDMAPADRAMLAQVVDVIHRHMGNHAELDTATLAQALGMSTDTLRQRLSELTGETTAAYVLHVRLDHARHLLHNSTIAVGDIAQQCGFQSNAHFARAFKQRYGITPTQCRREVKS